MTVDIQKEIADWESILKTQNGTLAQVESMIPGINPRNLHDLQKELSSALSDYKPGSEMSLALQMNPAVAGHLGLAVSYLLAKSVAVYAQKKLNEYKAQVN